MLIDKIQVQQVIFNLVRNAVEALETSKKREITIKTLPSDNGTLEVRIKDTGPGIDPHIGSVLILLGYNFEAGD